MEGLQDRQTREEAEQALHRHMMWASEGLLPLSVRAQYMKRVLDFPCRAGVWACEVAHTYPGMQIDGLESDKQQVGRARRRGEQEQIEQVQVHEYAAGQPLPFGEETFDLVHLSFPLPLIFPPDWSALLGECRRVLKRGGTINAVSIAPAPSGSEAFLSLVQRIEMVVEAQEGSGAERARVAAPGVYFCHYLRVAGFQGITYTMHPIDLSAARHPGGRAYHLLLIEDILQKQQALLGRPFMKREHFDLLVAQLQGDMAEEDVCTTGVIVSAIARR